jgi:pimeloyl-ACP methyl ester carboxylesterase
MSYRMRSGYRDLVWKWGYYMSNRSNFASFGAAGRSVIGILAVATAIGVLDLIGPPVFAQDGKKLDFPKPENMTLRANDGFNVFCTYYPGGFVQKSEKEVVPKPGKEVIPVILLHGFEGNRKEFEPLALSLQSAGHAVMTIDLRGHGDSSRIELPNGTEKMIEASRLRPADFRAMEMDVEAAKRFLLEKNNSGTVNLELLCLVGADLGGIVATNWIAADWSRKDLPAFKQGKYAKALVLLSPTNSVKGYSSTAAWKHPIYQLPIFSLMLIAGKRDSKSTSEAKQIHNRLEKAHPLPTDEKERVAKQSLFLIEPDTELVGAKMVDPRARLPVSSVIHQFITLRLVNKQSDFPWAERKNPLATD